MRENFNAFSSTGMEYFSVIPVLWMVQRGSLNVPLHRETHLCTSSAPSKLERFGTTLISVSFLSVFPFPFVAGQTGNALGEQYCDGIRGGLVVYDPEDPNRCEYDGKFKLFYIDIQTI